MNKKKILPALALVLGLAFIQPSTFAQDEKPAPAAPEAAAESPAPPADNEVVLIVDETPITARDVRELFTARYGRQFEQIPPEQRAMLEPQIQQAVVSELINKTLLLNAANADGLEASKEEVDDSLAQITKSIPEGTSLEDFVATAGITVERIREQITQDTKIRKLVEKVTNEAKAPTDEETKKYYDEHPEEFKQEASVEASHILISTRDLEDDAQIATKKKIAEELHAELLDKKGENFVELATAHSDCPSKAQGGSLGQFSKGQMVPEFEAAAFTQEVGKIGDLVKTDFGYHIIRVDAKNEAGETSYEDVKEQLTANLTSERKAKKMETYVTGLREKADIKQPGAENSPEAKSDAKPAEEKKG